MTASSPSAGGSGLDLGKCVAFMAGQTRPVWELEDIGDWWTRASVEGIADRRRSDDRRYRVRSRARQRHHQFGKSCEEGDLHPKFLPGRHDLRSGTDGRHAQGDHRRHGHGPAFAHCLEAYSSPFYHPMSAGIALEGMRLVKEYLPAAYKDGTGSRSPANMMSAAAMGAVAFQKGLGAIHSLSASPVGAIYNTHHGMTNAVVMPPGPAVQPLRDRGEDRARRRYLALRAVSTVFYHYVLQLPGGTRRPRQAVGAWCRHGPYRRKWPRWRSWIRRPAQPRRTDARCAKKLLRNAFDGSRR